MTVKRTSQVVAEALSTSTPKLRASQTIVEMLSSNLLSMHASQVVVEMISENVPDDIGGAPQPIQMIIAT